MDDKTIAQRLRDNADLDAAEHGNPDVVALEREAAGRIEALEAALRPFAEDAPRWKSVHDDHRPKFHQLAAPPDNAAFTVGDLRRAAAALDPK
jgi:hypothetical protein